MDRRNWRVLVVEDEPDIRHLITTILTVRWGCRVDEAEDGPEALALAAAHHFDIIFVDLVLPSLSGMQVIRALKSGMQSPQTRIIVISNHCWDEQYRSDALRAGATECLDKGDLFESFGETIDKLLHSESEPSLH